MCPPSPSPVPVEPGYFTVPDALGGPVRLLGSRCDACGEVQFPRRHVCAKCLGESLSDVELGPRGTLFAFTYTHLPMFNTRRAKQGGYAVGQVDLPEGPRVQAVLDGEEQDFEVGMTVTLDLEVLREREDGAPQVIFRFRPLTQEESDAL